MTKEELMRKAIELSVKNVAEGGGPFGAGGLSTQRHTHLAVGGFRVLAPKPYLHVSMYTAFH